jgi:hypothetical protein
MKSVDAEEINETECVVDAAGPIAKRFKSSDKSGGVLPLLPLGFHWEGEKPDVIANKLGVIIAVSRGVVNCPGYEWFRSLYHEDKNLDNQRKETNICLLCLNSCSAPGNRYSNTIKHIKTAHQDRILPWEHISENERRLVSTD